MLPTVGVKFYYVTINPHTGFREFRTNQKPDLYPKKRTKIFQNPDNLTECETSFLSNKRFIETATDRQRERQTDRQRERQT